MWSNKPEEKAEAKLYVETVAADPKDKTTAHKAASTCPTSVKCISMQYRQLPSPTATNIAS